MDLRKAFHEYVDVLLHQNGEINAASLGEFLSESGGPRALGFPTLFALLNSFDDFLVEKVNHVVTVRHRYNPALRLEQILVEKLTSYGKPIPFGTLQGYVGQQFGTLSCFKEEYGWNGLEEVLRHISPRIIFDQTRMIISLAPPQQQIDLPSKHDATPQTNISTSPIASSSTPSSPPSQSPSSSSLSSHPPIKASSLAVASSTLQTSLHTLSRLREIPPAKISKSEGFREIPARYSIESFIDAFHNSFDVIAVDIEANSEIDRIDLVQIALCSFNGSILTWLFQPQLCESTSQYLCHLLSDPTVLKIFHDARFDARLLYSNFNITMPAHSLIDTQLVYRHLTRSKKTISLGDLLKYCNLSPHETKKSITEEYRSNPDYWQNPSEAAKAYAAADVNQLIQSLLYLTRDYEIDNVEAILNHCNKRYRNLSELTIANHKIQLAVPLEWKTLELPSQLAASVEIDEDLSILEILPEYLKRACSAVLQSHPNDRLIEIRLDLDTQPCLVLSKCIRPIKIPTIITSKSTLNQCVSTIKEHCESPDTDVHIFTLDNRAVLPRSLHRISGIPSRFPSKDFPYKGLTYRVGRHIPSCLLPIEDIICRLCDHRSQSEMDTGLLVPPSSDALDHMLRPTPRPSLLLIGPPGVGKTTLLRAIIAKLSTDPYNMSVIVIDTSGEIAGMGDSPHPCIQDARQMHVPSRKAQASVMIEAVQNHMPDLVVVDEIGTDEETRAARLIGPKGVSLVATAHGTTLRDLIDNPMLNLLIGGKQAVILSASEVGKKAKYAHKKPKSGVVRKTQVERVGKPVFDIAIEIRSRYHYIIYHDVAAAVDDLLEGITPQQDIRIIQEDPSGARKMFSCIRE